MCADLLEADGPAGGVLNEPRVEAPADGSRGVMAVEEELREGEVVGNGREGVCVNVSHDVARGETMQTAKGECLSRGCRIERSWGGRSSGISQGLATERSDRARREVVPRLTLLARTPRTKTHAPPLPRASPKRTDARRHSNGRAAHRVYEAHCAGG